MEKQPSPAQCTSQVISNTFIADNCLIMYLDRDPRTPQPQAGQFINVLAPSYPIPLLRRPFAFATMAQDRFAFIYDIRGRATADMAKLKPGDTLDWIGPLGRPFPLPAALDLSRLTLIAGGAGIGPMYLLHTTLIQGGYSPLLIIGAASASNLPQLEWPDNGEVRFCTEDGSSGIQGNVTAALDQKEIKAACFYSCGPHMMMNAIEKLAAQAARPHWVSMEEIMACGIGTCQGCAIKTINGNKLVCTDGPVFDARQLVW